LREEPRHNPHFFAMKYDDRHTIKIGSNGHAPARIAPALTGRTIDRSKDVSAPAPAAPPPSRKPRIRRGILFTVGLVALVAGGLWLREWWSVGRFVEATDDAFVGADITTIAPKVSGFVVSVAVTDNQRVRAGDLLTVIDDRDYRAELAKEEATVREQEATLANLDASAQLQAAVIEQARAKTVSTVAERQRAEADGVRARNLVKRKVISEQDFEQVDATATKAQADDDAAKATLVAAERQVVVIETQKRQAQAAFAHAKAALELAQLSLSYTEIRSPIDGVIGNRHARVGDYATVGAQLMSIVPVSGLYVDANFKESQIANMRPGQRAVIEADILRGVKFQGTVQSLAPATGSQFFCRRKMRPAISPRSSSAFPFASIWKARLENWVSSGRACRSSPGWINADSP
jgi:membrane fusion protein, multidrug efflux system